MLWRPIDAVALPFVLVFALNNLRLLGRLAPDEPSTPILYDDAEGSARLLLEAAQSPRPVFDEAWSEDEETERCQRYSQRNKLRYKGRKRRRRVFWGSLVADDSWHMIASVALETYGIFDSVALVESNRTQMYNERKIRFGPSSEALKVLKSGMFGPNTKVSVDYYVNEEPRPTGLGREHAQRALIIQRWKENGMKDDDIGYLSDMDETFSRDFIRAMQLCDVKEFDDHENCKVPKVQGRSLQFEGGPECMTDRRWHQPSMIVGRCVEGIGNSSQHPKPDRTYHGTAWMERNYTRETGFAALPKNATHFPLWNAADFRRLFGNLYGQGHVYVGYHFHNFFASADVLRRKYHTYGHPEKNAMTMKLGDIRKNFGDLQALVNCGLNKMEEPGLKYPLTSGGLQSLNKTFDIPLAFKVPGYVEGRMKELRAMVLLDELRDREY